MKLSATELIHSLCVGLKLLSMMLFLGATLLSQVLSLGMGCEPRMNMVDRLLSHCADEEINARLNPMNCHRAGALLRRSFRMPPPAEWQIQGCSLVASLAFSGRLLQMRKQDLLCANVERGPERKEDSRAWRRGGDQEISVWENYRVLRRKVCVGHLGILSFQTYFLLSCINNKVILAACPI